ncbi:hypothetical protein ACPPVV_07845 [Rhodanobacter sp. Col0626]|uniref:hypothetical protein n=1 Tax=Rhodanobacter sp. Col0626 TaxID=3415679 RepID=UPI003CF8B4E0
MKRLVLIGVCTVLSACGGTHGLRDENPNLSSHTDKNVASYVECARAKWAALSPAAAGSSKGEEGHVSATDKEGAHELLDVTSDGKGAQVTMYERQNMKKNYNSRYREEAISCL